MRYFVILLHQEENGITDATQRAYEAMPRSRGLEFRWTSFHQAAVLTAWDDDFGDPLVVADGDHIAVGVARLDNRPDLERRYGPGSRSLTDLELVLRTVAQHGRRYVPQFLGDFGFVVWSPAARTAIAACDAFAINRLYYRERKNLIAFASRAEALALEDRYEAQYLAELVGNCSLTPGLSVYAGVRSVPDGCITVVEHGRLTTSRYWSASNFEPQPVQAKAERQVVESCRELFAESVRLRVTCNGAIWAQLSGGMDSSSVVSMAQWLVEQEKTEHGLAGTVSYVDRQGTPSDERAYSDLVVGRWGVSNRTIVDSPLWYDGEYPLPRTDQPRMEYPFYPHERKLCSIVRAAGGRVILTGVGGDELFGGYMIYVADWLARGRILPALREVARRAAIGRVSFWQLAYHDVLLPLLPRTVRNSLVRAGGTIPAWVTEAVTRRYDLRSHTFAASFGAGRIGRKYQHATSSLVTSIARLMEPGVIGDALEIRHPFLYRPLVEFALRLPPELCARPYQRKWVLREAMRGILPDVIRTRIGKGSPADLYAWSLTALRPLLEPLIREPMLADLGIIDAVRLRTDFYTAPEQPGSIYHLHDLIYTTLAIEAWLQARSGRWPRGDHRSWIHH
ncbi:MAG: asparagine synthetase B family protein [Gemmatimonadales bacterium]